MQRSEWLAALSGLAISLVVTAGVAPAALAGGSFSMLDAENPHILSWLRQAPPVVVSVSFSADPQTVSLSVPGTTGKLKTLIKSQGAADPESTAKITLLPFGVYAGEVR
jgi:hypothetical protein